MTTMLKNDFFDFVLACFDTKNAYVVGGAALWNYATKNMLADYALKDIDVCVLDTEYELPPHMKNAIVKESPFATTFRFPWASVPVQLLKTDRAENINDVLKTFDLSLSRIAYHPKKFWVADKTFSCRPFEICACKDQLYTFARVIKFVKRGFAFNTESLVAAGLTGDYANFKSSLGES